MPGAGRGDLFKGIFYPTSVVTLHDGVVLQQDPTNLPLEVQLRIFFMVWWGNEYIATGPK